MPGFEAFFPVAGHGVSRHGHDRQVGLRSAFLVPDGRRGLEPVHDGHLDIHQNQVERASAPALQGLPSPLFGDRDLVASVFENPDGQLLVDDIVLGQKDGVARVGRRQAYAG